MIELVLGKVFGTHPPILGCRYTFVFLFGSVHSPSFTSSLETRTAEESCHAQITKVKVRIKEFKASDVSGQSCHAQITKARYLDPSLDVP